MRKTYRISVVGAGSWGTTIANMLAKNGHIVTLWVRSNGLLNQLIYSKENTIYLKGVKLDENIYFTGDLSYAFKDKDIIAIAVPVLFLRNTLKDINFSVESIILSLCKGIEVESLFTPTEIIKNVIKVNEQKLAVLSGPNFASEVAKSLPTATVIASENRKIATLLQKIFASETFRVYTSCDIKGVEICGAMKNVMAIASGISDGLNLGHNARASLITRGIAEMIRFGKQLGARMETFMGLAGIGDLILTCTGNLSRNRTVGMRLARGENINEILKTMKMVPEGVSTTKAINEFARKSGLDLPITVEVYKIIYEHKKPIEALKNLMNRPLKEENYLL